MKSEFKTLQDLYNRIMPALSSKVIELKRENKNYIKEEDIWNYLSEKLWSKQSDLTLYGMTSDILNLDNYIIDDYVLDKLKNEKREIKKETELL